MTLDLFKSVNGVDESALHEKFKLLRDTLPAEREILNEWVKGFEDRDGKIVKEFQTTFHSSFWEFYLYSVFKEAGCLIDFSKNRPDFMISGPTPFNVEAVVSNIKEGGRTELSRDWGDVLSGMVPLNMGEEFREVTNEATVRHSNAIIGKRDKYIKGYSQCEWVDRETPFVIALGAFDQVQYGREFYYPLLLLLYGMMFYPEENVYRKVKDIIKPGTSSEIPVGVFQDPAMEDVSAVVFSCVTTLGKLTALAKSQANPLSHLQHVVNIRHDCDAPYYKLHYVEKETPEYLSDGLFVFHNPNARNPMPWDVFAKTNAVQLTLDGKELVFEGENLPIVSRVNMSRIICPNKTMLLNEIALNIYPDGITNNSD